MKTILACVDFSDATGGVVHAALQVAAGSKGTLHLLHVADDEATVLNVAGVPLVTPADGEAAPKAQRALQELADICRKKGVDVATHVIGGDFADAILDAAQKLGADLIVTGAHHHGTLRSLFSSTVTDDVLKRTVVPVMVVPRIAKE